MSTATFMKRMESLHGQVPKEDGMGYITDHVQGGAGFSYTRYSHKDFPNKRRVLLYERSPSPFANGEGITAEYSVWLGQTDDGANGPCPFPLPPGAKPEAWCPDAEVNWYADFGEDGEAAEKYAKSLADVNV